LPDWPDLGFITPDFSRSVSGGIEYVLDDFAVHQVALGEGNDTESAKYWVRSQNWRNFGNPAAMSLGFRGFVDPRNRSGFVPLEPLKLAATGLISYIRARRGNTASIRTMM